jgi:uncharacterized protein YggU (UPF0235/DUF167 family)
MSTARLELKVVPRATRTEVVGWLGDRLKLRVAAVPEAGRANAAIISLLSRELGVPERRLRIVSGHGAQRKTNRGAEPPCKRHWNFLRRSLQ